MRASHNHPESYIYGATIRDRAQYCGTETPRGSDVPKEMIEKKARLQRPAAAIRDGKKKSRTRTKSQTHPTLKSRNLLRKPSRKVPIRKKDNRIAKEIGETKKIVRPAVTGRKRSSQNPKAKRKARPSKTTLPISKGSYRLYYRQHGLLTGEGTHLKSSKWDSSTKITNGDIERDRAKHVSQISRIAKRSARRPYFAQIVPDKEKSEEDMERWQNETKIHWIPPRRVVTPRSIYLQTKTRRNPFSTDSQKEKKRRRDPFKHPNAESVTYVRL